MLTMFVFFSEVRKGAARTFGVFQTPGGIPDTKGERVCCMSFSLGAGALFVFQREVVKAICVVYTAYDAIGLKPN